MIRIGSDEDDEDADESQSADDPSETAVSRDAMMEKSQSVDDGDELPDDRTGEEEEDGDCDVKPSLNGQVKDNNGIHFNYIFIFKSLQLFLSVN